MLEETLFGIEVLPNKPTVGATHWVINHKDWYCFNVTVTKISKSGKSFGWNGFDPILGHHYEMDFIAHVPVKYFRPTKPTEDELLILKAQYLTVPHVGDTHWALLDDVYYPAKVFRTTKKGFYFYGTDDKGEQFMSTTATPNEKWRSECPII